MESKVSKYEYQKNGLFYVNEYNYFLLILYFVLKYERIAFNIKTEKGFQNS